MISWSVISEIERAEKTRRKKSQRVREAERRITLMYKKIRDQNQRSLHTVNQQTLYRHSNHDNGYNTIITKNTAINHYFWYQHYLKWLVQWTYRFFSICALDYGKKSTAPKDLFYWTGVGSDSMCICVVSIWTYKHIRGLDVEIKTKSKYRYQWHDFLS